MSYKNNQKIKFLVRNILKEEEDFEIPDSWQDFDTFEFHDSAKNAAMQDIGDNFEEIGTNKFEKNLTQQDFADQVSLANLKLNNNEKEVKKIQKGLDFKKQGEDKLKKIANKFGTKALSINENTDQEYNFDQTNLYKFLKDALYIFIEESYDYADAAEILENELNKYFNIKKK